MRQTSGGFTWWFGIIATNRHQRSHKRVVRLYTVRTGQNGFSSIIGPRALLLVELNTTNSRLLFVSFTKFVIRERGQRTAMHRFLWFLTSNVASWRAVKSGAPSDWICYRCHAVNASASNNDQWSPQLRFNPYFTVHEIKDQLCKLWPWYL